MKLCILAGYKLFFKKIQAWGQSVHFWSCDITKHGIYQIDHISDILKDRDFRTKKIVENMRSIFHYFAFIKCISGHVAGINCFVKEKKV